MNQDKQLDNCELVKCENSLANNVNNDYELFDEFYEVVQEKLKAGQVYKNYIELCSVLGQPICGGKQKTLQLETLKRYFDCETVGRRFLITEIYNTPLEKKDGRRNGNNSIYVKHVECILLYYLSKQTGGICTLTTKRINNILGIAPLKYYETTDSELQKICGDITEFNVNFYINNFRQRSNQKFREILFSSLNNLKNRFLISYYEEVIIVDKDENRFKANDNQIRCIDAVKRDVLDLMNLISITQVFQKFKQKEFYTEVNNRLMELYDWQYSYKQYKIIYTNSNIIKAIPIAEAELERFALNEKVIEAINTNAKNSYDRQEEKWKHAYDSKTKELNDPDLYWGIGDLRPDERGIGVFRYPNDYIEIQEILTDALIRIKNDKSENVINIEFITEDKPP